MQYPKICIEFIYLLLSVSNKLKWISCIIFKWCAMLGFWAWLQQTPQAKMTLSYMCKWIFRVFLNKRGFFCNWLLGVRDANRLKMLIKRYVLSLGLTETLWRVWVRWGNNEQCLPSPHAQHACWRGHSATGWFNHYVIGRAKDCHSVCTGRRT